MSDQSERILELEANQGIIACLKYLTKNWRGPRSCHPDEAYDPYYALGTHPDLVMRLWDTLPSHLPVDCRWVVYTRPALVHPQTGLIFAFATGSQTYTFRIPALHRAAIGPPPFVQVNRYPGGNVVDLGQFDPDWIFGGRLDDEESVCRLAFDLAAAQS